jgi:hypothetical protein
MRNVCYMLLLEQCLFRLVQEKCLLILLQEMCPLMLMVEKCLLMLLQEKLLPIIMHEMCLLLLLKEKCLLMLLQENYLADSPAGEMSRLLRNKVLQKNVCLFSYCKYVCLIVCVIYACLVLAAELLLCSAFKVRSGCSAFFVSRPVIQRAYEILITYSRYSLFPFAVEVESQKVKQESILSK